MCFWLYIIIAMNSRCFVFNRIYKFTLTPRIMKSSMYALRTYLCPFRKRNNKNLHKQYLKE